MTIGIAHMEIRFAPWGHLVDSPGEVPFPWSTPRTHQRRKRGRSASPFGSRGCRVSDWG